MWKNRLVVIRVTIQNAARHKPPFSGVSITGQSCYNANGIQIAVNCLPGSGKSHGTKMHLHLIRARHKDQRQHISAKALYYAEFKAGTYSFL